MEEMLDSGESLDVDMSDGCLTTSTVLIQLVTLSLSQFVNRECFLFINIEDPQELIGVGGTSFSGEQRASCGKET